MRALVQRVQWAKVVVDGQTVGDIGPGLLTFLGIGKGDTEADLEKLLQKILNLRVFEDENGKMNRSIRDTGGAHLIVSQFTLYADTRKGNRPSFVAAAPPAEAEKLYKRALELSAQSGVQTAGGQFQADMKVSLLNDGPVTLWIEMPEVANG
jgi:D-tyrosyl-tRNA(Tyr) deacylase